MLQALLVGLIAGIGILDERVLGATLFGRPIVLSVFVGLVLGDIKQGIIIGAQLELIWMGIAGIGVSTPPDYVTGGVIGTALAIISHRGIGVALTIAVPVAVLAANLGTLVRVVNLWFSHKADKYAETANFKGVNMMLLLPTILFFLSTFIPTFLAMLLGASKINIIINAIPKVILEGLTVAGNLLPAVGFALLLDMLFSKKMFVFFFLGFLMCSYLKLNITGIAVIAVCLAIIIVLFGGSNKDKAEKENKKSGTSDNLTEGEIDFE
ncbi:MAG: PTS mannose/fructose/sorbose/N-acetylgalactosamine transporter subunit IIC [Lactobacillus panisapium]|uniref:PTS mannose/fructose/sorbose/N-acetylgalactosamine transporter subunit IIC n=1 Tax=Lactobacillus TaxID=1578 RepID=UPI001C6961C5|nr:MULTISPECIES: PTS sugar transporter subunit IIC [Lactobacillus]MCO6532141.1 PTS sugar transporter subunit IIC [Lactobacillus sp.]MCO6535808.1 PTS sugar transporter subunit IIC [Lactobacillus sp.]QYN58024.1 PTS sugar transporter subunit IIC [Lactobacillus panisapium]